jgi:hypothetical protein
MSVVEFGEYRDEVGKAPACYVFEKTWLHISAHRPTILTEIFRVYPSHSR